MAKRKTATRAARPSAHGRTTAKGGRSAAKTGRSAGADVVGRAASPKASGRQTGAGKGSPTRSTPPTGSQAKAHSTGGRRKPVREPRDVTAEVQRRWDLEEESVPTPPSTLTYERHASAARTGRAVMEKRRRKHTEASPAITGGDVDADWEGAYAVGDEAATGDNPTPDQDNVEEVGHAVGVDYEDTEELKSTPKIERRDRKRWELDPASSEDYKERTKKKA